MYIPSLSIKSSCTTNRGVNRYTWLIIAYELQHGFRGNYIRLFQVFVICMHILNATHKLLTMYIVNVHFGCISCLESTTLFRNNAYLLVSNILYCSLKLLILSILLLNKAKNFEYAAEINLRVSWLCWKVYEVYQKVSHNCFGTNEPWYLAMVCEKRTQEHH